MPNMVGAIGGDDACGWRCVPRAWHWLFFQDERDFLAALRCLDAITDQYIDGLFEWMDSPRGQLYDEVRETAWHYLQKVDVDATHRKLIWDDGKRLSIDESVQRLLGDFPGFPVELIETRLIAWLEMEFVPKAYSQGQIDELDRLTEAWTNAHYSQRQAALK